LSRLSGTLHGLFTKGTPTYIEFLPQGMDEVHAAKEAEVLPILDRVLGAAQTHLPASVAELTALRTQWLAVYQAASAGRGGTAAADQSRQEATRAMQLQLTKNLLELARQFVGRTDKANDFFDQSRLYNRKRAEDVPEPAVT
jgi:hypothetical protein